ncbi:hypothetical protein RHMOL_Rhmol01G0047600 [Rhododendron molle]|uniref:Uncharacterized protein n=1 Tax=Rhododendron molle TaxID=49168 RepID=A0ACC0PYP5_RHOML|nr:hypothetical protein RHMOL_Rhmol01G0047600 [Rhododendron molle]
MAARDGLLFARELGLDAILIEGDSQHLVKLVQRRMQGRPSGGWGDFSRYLTPSRWVFWCGVFVCQEEW